MTTRMLPDNMDQDFSWAEGWSAWRVWKHPRQARDLIDESVIKFMELNQKIDITENISTLRASLEAREREIAQRDAMIARRDEELQQLRESLASVNASLSEAHEELAFQRDVDEKIEEFRKELEKVEELKLYYTNKVKNLEAQLIATRNELETAQEKIAVESAKIAFGEKEKPHENKAELLRRKYMEKRAPGLPYPEDKDDSSDDWLLNLPSDLI